VSSIRKKNRVTLTHRPNTPFARRKGASTMGVPHRNTGISNSSTSANLRNNLRTTPRPVRRRRSSSSLLLRKKASPNFKLSNFEEGIPACFLGSPKDFKKYVKVSSDDCVYPVGPNKERLFFWSNQSERKSFLKVQTKFVSRKKIKLKQDMKKILRKNHISRAIVYLDKEIYDPLGLVSAKSTSIQGDEDKLQVLKFIRTRSGSIRLIKNPRRRRSRSRNLSNLDLSLDGSSILPERTPRKRPRAFEEFLEARHKYKPIAIRQMVKLYKSDRSQQGTGILQELGLDEFEQEKESFEKSRVRHRRKKKPKRPTTNQTIEDLSPIKRKQRKKKKGYVPPSDSNPNRFIQFDAKGGRRFSREQVEDGIRRQNEHKRRNPDEHYSGGKGVNVPARTGGMGGTDPKKEKC